AIQARPGNSAERTLRYRGILLSHSLTIGADDNPAVWKKDAVEHKEKTGKASGDPHQGVIELIVGLEGSVSDQAKDALCAADERNGLGLAMLVVRERLHITTKPGKMSFDVTWRHDVQPEQVGSDVEFVERGIARETAVGLHRWKQVIEAYSLLRKIDRC